MFLKKLQLWLNAFLAITLLTTSIVGPPIIPVHGNKPSARVHFGADPSSEEVTVKKTGLMAKAVPDQQTGGITIEYNNFEGNGIYGLSSSISLIAENNYWGDAGGPIHASNPQGQGDAVSDNVDFDPWLTSPVDIGIPLPPYPEPGEVIIEGNNIEENGSFGVESTIAVAAESNWWGDASGPYHPTENQSGTGDEVSDNVDFFPWATAPVVVGEYETSHQGSPSSLNTTYVADPVNVVLGNYTYQHTDLSTAGRGPHFEFTRTYNSAYPAYGPLGYGWTHSYQQRIVIEDVDELTVYHGDGRQDRYIDIGGGIWMPPAGIDDTLIKNIDNSYTLTKKDQTVYEYDETGLLISITDPNGNSLTLGYTGNNLTSITDAAGRVATLYYDAADRIQQIMDAAARSVVFAYDVSGDLVSFTDARGQLTTYTYNSQHQLTGITDANGHRFLHNIYNAAGKVVEQRDAFDNLTTFAYDPVNLETTVTDPLGRITVHTYDGQFRTTGERDALGYSSTITYNGQNKRASYTDKNGGTTYYDYDLQGNNTAITDTLGAVTAMVYDANNNLTSRIDPLGRTTTYTYDAANNLVQIDDPEVGITTFTYDSLGQLTGSTDANGHGTTFAYDVYGNQTSETDALGHSSSATYDIAGRMLSESDANGNTTAYTYDAHDNVLTETDALGNTTTYTYDAVGKLQTETDALNRVTSYTYNEMNQLLSVTDPLSGVRSYTYDAVNNQVTATDANGHTTLTGYDALNRVISVTNPISVTTTFTYDGLGNRLSATDGNGHSRTFTYDSENRLLSTADELGNTISHTYDAAGNNLTITDPLGHVTSYTYDNLNRLSTVTDALNGVVSYTYDAVGNRTAVTDANNHTTTFVFDDADRLVSITDPLSNVTSFGYDAAGNRTSILDGNGETSTTSYDALNRPSVITFPAETVSLTYDAVGNLLTMVDDTGTTIYTYDDLDRPLTVAAGSGDVVGYAYDAAGNRTAITYPSGDVVSYAYDAADRLATVTDWNGRETHYTYDAANNLLTQSNANGTSATYGYDAADRLKNLVNSGPTGVISSFNYTLDAAGNRTQVTEANGDTTTYSYDDLSRLVQVDQELALDLNGDCQIDEADLQLAAPAWRTADPLYDLNASGLVRVDDLNLIASRTGQRCEQSTYVYDPSGNRISLTTADGTLTYTYDAADRLTARSDGTSFSWDNNGNMTGKGANVYTFNARNQLINATDGQSAATYRYDGHGNRIGKEVDGVNASYTLDMISELPVVLEEDRDGVTTRYIYGLDLIAEVAVDGSATTYHVDGLGSTRNMTDESGQVVAEYSYDAFGQERGIAGTDSELTYTGEQSDSEFGLVYLRARYYDPELGRFLSRDPFPALARDSQSLNRYVYVTNNPVNDTDPSGELAVLAAIAVGAVIGGAANVLDYAINKGDAEWDWGKAAGSFAVGATVGAAIPAVGMVAAASSASALVAGGITMAAGTLISTVGNVAQNEIIGREHTLENTLGKGILHGAFGGLGSAIGHTFGHGAGLLVKQIPNVIEVDRLLRKLDRQAQNMSLYANSAPDGVFIPEIRATMQPIGAASDGK